jgi:hypothetical protein
MLVVNWSLLRNVRSSDLFTRQIKITHRRKKIESSLAEEMTTRRVYRTEREQARPSGEHYLGFVL